MWSFREFEVTDPFGAVWKVGFRWLQNAVSIRHADAVDVKFFIDDGSGEQEKVVALSHPHLLQVSGETGVPLTDLWCMKLAALHVEQMIETGEDLEKALVAPTLKDLREHAAAVR
jgi:hypothetical protein